jgi:arsenate reductase
MKKIYCLSTCSTCKRILKDIHAEKKGFQFQDIKTERISRVQLEEMKAMAGSYSNLFSRRAQKYKELGLKDLDLDEEDLKKLILAEYSFLKRPVILSGKKIFIGSERNTLAALKKEFNPGS